MCIFELYSSWNRKHKPKKSGKSSCINLVFLEHQFENMWSISELGQKVKKKSHSWHPCTDLYTVYMSMYRPHRHTAFSAQGNPKWEQGQQRETYCTTRSALWTVSVHGGTCGISWFYHHVLCTAAEKSCKAKTAATTWRLKGPRLNSEWCPPTAELGQLVKQDAMWNKIHLLLSHILKHHFSECTVVKRKPDMHQPFFSRDLQMHNMCQHYGQSIFIISLHFRKHDARWMDDANGWCASALPCFLCHAFIT